MCGISGIYLAGRRERISFDAEAVVRAMNGTMTHRGPDAAVWPVVVRFELAALFHAGQAPALVRCAECRAVPPPGARPISAPRRVSSIRAAQTFSQNPLPAARLADQALSVWTFALRREFFRRAR